MNHTKWERRTRVRVNQTKQLVFLNALALSVFILYVSRCPVFTTELLESDQEGRGMHQGGGYDGCRKHLCL